MTTVPRYKLVCCDVILKMIGLICYVYLSDLWWGERFTEKYDEDTPTALFISVIMILPIFAIVYMYSKSCYKCICQRKSKKHINNIAKDIEMSQPV